MKWRIQTVYLKTLYVLLALAAFALASGAGANWR